MSELVIMDSRWRPKVTFTGELATKVRHALAKSGNTEECSLFNPDETICFTHITKNFTLPIKSVSIHLYVGDRIAKEST